MIHLLIARHGETLENARRILQGQLPGHLSPLGREQALRLGAQLQGEKLDLIVSSDLQRAMDTTQLLNSLLHLPVEPCSLLRERDWGPLTGVCTEEQEVRPDDFPETVESQPRLMERAHRLIAYLLAHHDGKRLLLVGHGYFNRCILAAIEGLTPHDVPRWGNTEVRRAQIAQPDEPEPQPSLP